MPVDNATLPAGLAETSPLVPFLREDPLDVAAAADEVTMGADPTAVARGACTTLPYSWDSRSASSARTQIKYTDLYGNSETGQILVVNMLHK